MPIFKNHYGEFTLEVLHASNKAPLQAWNAADELALNEIQQLNLTSPRTLLVNDSYGALGTSLHAWNPYHWTDSYCSYLSWRQNIERNGLVLDTSRFIPSTAEPQDYFDLVIIKVPKTLSLLQYQLQRLRPHLKSSTLIVGAGMVKHLSRSMIECFAAYIGPTKTSLATKKARLVFSTYDPQLTPNEPAIRRYTVPGSPLQLATMANVFAQQKIDLGTAFLLEQLGSIPAPQKAIDLGCGNGALGCYIAWRHPNAEIVFCDESYLAIASAKTSWQLNRLANPVEFQIDDGLTNTPTEADLILCNPPFHQGNRLDYQTAQRLFRAACKNLTKDGILLVVGNRHLNYHQSLKRYFKQATLIASNPKFVILKATSPCETFL